ncbi:MAG TPA: 4,5-DOPA dioxygenase extradiol [Rhodocyclaceae bacterium]|nr:4,5-DOPA dioxygenase extradiol [Rhodocyclaceae bacterium]
MPALFIGHGSPMNAIEDTLWSRSWQTLGNDLRKNYPRPTAILVVSAHWMTQGVAATAMTHPKTIHDFGGFPDKLFAVQYPAPGSAGLAERIQSLLAPLPVRLDQGWGLDHGAWSVLVHLFPDADIPVVQLSLDLSQPASFHYELGRQLRALRDEGILIIASGNVVHNLRLIQWRSGAAPDWSARVEQRVVDCLEQRDHQALIDYSTLDPEALLAIPTPEHYLPLLYIAGLQSENETATFPLRGIDLGTISMLSVKLG